MVQKPSAVDYFVILNRGEGCVCVEFDFLENISVSL